MANINFDVPLVTQKSQYTCWLASYRMVEKWYRGLGLKRNEISRKELLRFSKGEVPLKGDNIDAFARKTGMTILHRKPTLEEITKLVQTYGPLWYPGFTGTHKATTNGHVVVITGVEGDNIVHNDPWPEGGVGSKNQLFDAETFLGEYLKPTADPAPFLVMLKNSQPKG